MTGIGILILLAGFVGYRMYQTHLAHTTFERYYAFRGCNELVDKTATSSDCRLANGQVIKIVFYKGGWYLDGDLPISLGNFTF